MSAPFRLFDAVGIELEYMIVDAQTLDVRPVSDRVLKASLTDGGLTIDDAELGDSGDSGVPSEVAVSRIDGEKTTRPVSWSNELTAHVIEIKTTAPLPAALVDVAAANDFQAHVRAINKRLAVTSAHPCRLLGSAMHPWMDPHKEKVLWPHGFAEFYRTFDRIFDCRGHGWANLESMHINLPFADDEEFAKLHAAIRLVLPILPALAASSPIMDRRWTNVLDNRLAVYKTNARNVPLVSGRVIPERAFSRCEYDREVFEPMYEQIAPHDPGGILRHEWLNARGAIARFDRGAIEIRVIDVQECPLADLAIASVVVELVKDLVAGRWWTAAELRQWEVEPLAHIFDECIKHADGALIRDRTYLSAFGLTSNAATARELWQHIEHTLSGRIAPEFRTALLTIFREGCLARRIGKALGPPIKFGEDAIGAAPVELPREALETIYRELADCLHQGRMFRG